MSIHQFKTSLIEHQLKRFHFIGIGGVGMRALAKMILQLGFEVSGSDLHPCEEVCEWAKRGLISLYDNHENQCIGQADCIIYSSAIQSTNPEYQSAKESKIPMFHRSEMIAWMGRFFKVIAVSGTHGKTSTSAMVAHILEQSGYAPSYCVGASSDGEILAHVGAGEWLVLEADESDQSFLKYAPAIALVTNINYDHMENYHNRKDLYEQCFYDFLSRATVAKIFNHITGELPKCIESIPDLHVIQKKNLTIHQNQQRGPILESSCTLNDQLLNIQMQVAGVHMLHNALLAIECAEKVGIPRQDAATALRGFKGTDRRFQIHMINNHPVVSDYGHHPEEIRVTLQAARAVWPNKKLHLIFEPHRYSRLRYHFNGFLDVLSQADQLVLVPIYGAGEVEDSIYHIPYLMECLCAYSPVYLSSLQKIDEYLSMQGENDVVILQGAGDIGHVLKRVNHESDA